MAEMLWGSLWLGRVLPMIADLGIADELAGGPRLVPELARATGTDPDALGRCLRALASVGVFGDDGSGAYINTPLSETLRRDAPVSMRGMARLIGLPCHLRAWDSFPDALRSDGSRSVWELAHEMPLFAYFAEHAADAAVFQEGMTAFSGIEAQAVVDAYDFQHVETVVDVGGGHGLLLATILGANPGVDGVLFELPFMLEGARGLLAGAGMNERCRIEGGDFFASVPAGDTHILKNIVHDFDDDQVVTILRNCRAAVSPGGRVLIVQEALPPGDAPSFGKLLDLQMLLIGGRERTESQYRALLNDSGYELTRIIETACPLHIIEARAIPPS
jgi:O-methyltransferase domain